jgi:hypothetical protein
MQLLLSISLLLLVLLSFYYFKLFKAAKVKQNWKASICLLVELEAGR